jgi:periplasmic protein TonB
MRPLAETSMRFLPLATLLFIDFELVVAAQEASPAPIKVSPDVAREFIVQRVAPVYPPLARQARIQGTVTLNIVIGKSGDVRSMQLISGHPMLAPAAVEAVKQWKYRPYEQDGEAVEIETTVQVSFKLAGG